MDEPEENHYKWDLFYYNPDDPCLFVPKRIRWTGYTLNFANPLAYLFVAAALFIVGIIPWIFR